MEDKEEDKEEQQPGRTPVIIKLHPQPEEYVEAETAFLRAVGLCVTQWAFVDRQLFRLFRFGIGALTHRAAILYYDQNTIGRRAGQINNLLKSAFEGPDNESWLKKWESLHQRLRDLLPIRNAIAHQPVQRMGTSDGTKAIYVYAIYLEPYARHLKENRNVYRDKESLNTDDLIQHSNDVNALESDLCEFANKIVEASR